MNVGTTLADLGSDALNLAQVTEAGRYFNRFRIFASYNNANQIARQRQQALYAKEAGKYVIYGFTPNTTVTATLWNDTYSDLAVAEALWCEQNGIDEFSFANEEELRIDSVTIADPFALVASYYKPTATAIKAVYSGIVSFCISNGAESWIENITPGDIDKVGFNAYGDYDAALGRCSHSTFVTRINAFMGYENWGDRLYISEFNVDYNETRFATIASNDILLGIEMAQKYNALEDAGYTDIYPFCWKYSNTLDWFSMKKNDDSYRDFMQVVSTGNKRRFLVNFN